MCVCVWRGCVLACVRVCYFLFFLCVFSRALCEYVYDFLLFFLSRSRALFTSMCFPLFFFGALARAVVCIIPPFFCALVCPVCVFSFFCARAVCVRVCVRARVCVYVCGLVCTCVYFPFFLFHVNE